jgi:hypothetical protein
VKSGLGTFLIQIAEVLHLKIARPASILIL